MKLKILNKHLILWKRTNGSETKFNENYSHQTTRPMAHVQSRIFLFLNDLFQKT
jgi:hypothetical protein